MAIGQRVRRSDAVDKVTGRGKYTGDFSLPGMLWARLERSPHAHARIVGYDLEAARRVPGVVAVISAPMMTDIDPFFGPAFRDQPILAVDEVRFQGEPVVAVVAESEAAAAQGAELVHVAYEPLAAVLTLDEALAPKAPLVHGESLRLSGHYQDLHHLGGGGKNVAHEFHYAHGNPVEPYFGEPEARVFEDVVTYPMVHHYMMEPYGCLADWQGDRVSVTATTQHPFGVRKEVAQIFGLPYSRVRVVVPYIGGAFGAKSYTKVEPLAVALSRYCSRPVRLCLSTAESFVTGRKPAARTRVRTAVNADGTILARHVEIWYVLGAYADVGPRVTQKGGYTALGPYRVPNAQIDAYGVYTHTVPAVAFRGYGVPQTSLGYEPQMDRIAEALGMDPVEIRKINLLHHDDHYAPTDTTVDTDLPGNLERLTERIAPGPAESPYRGRGIALSIKTSLAPSVSQAVVHLHHDGSATVFSSTVEIGQGARTVLGQIAADSLEIPWERVEVVLSDTAVTPYDQATSSSRSTTLNGYACEQAALDIKRQLAELGAQHWDVDLESVEVGSGRVRCGVGELEYGALIQACYGSQGGDLVGRGMYQGRPNDSPLGASTPFWETGLAGIEVSVDPETGMVQVERLASLADVGQAIHPDLVEGQDEGAMMMGLGHALWEKMVYQDGQLLNGNLVDYRVPMMTDVPRTMDSVIVENHDGPGPRGAKGVGESATTVMGAAVVSAVYYATGVRFKDLPLHPETVWRALQA